MSGVQCVKILMIQLWVFWCCLNIFMAVIYIRRNSSAFRAALNGFSAGISFAMICYLTKVLCANVGVR